MRTKSHKPEAAYEIKKLLQLSLVNLFINGLVLHIIACNEGNTCVPNTMFMVEYSSFFLSFFLNVLLVFAFPLINTT